MNTYLNQKQAEFDKTVDFFQAEIAHLRIGRATASLLDKVLVLSYGAKAPLNTVASISVQDAQSMIVAPWDKNLLKETEKGIAEANLGVGVVNEGDKIRITIPQMTEEKRKEIVKQLNHKMEESRITLRKLRDEVKNEIEQAERNKEISEDDKFRFLHELEDLTHKKNEELKKLRDKKEEDVMKI